MGIVRGTVPVPRINLSNVRLTQRHVNSFLLGQYLKGANINSAREQTTVNDFFLSPSPQDAPVTQFQPWLADRFLILSNSAKHLVDGTRQTNHTLSVDEDA